MGDTQKNPFKKAYTYFRVYTIQHTYIYITLYFYHTYKIIMSTTILVNIFTIRGYIVRKNFIPAKLEKQMILWQYFERYFEIKRKRVFAHNEYLVIMSTKIALDLIDLSDNCFEYIFIGEFYE